MEKNEKTILHYYGDKVFLNYCKSYIYNKTGEIQSLVIAPMNNMGEP